VIVGGVTHRKRRDFDGQLIATIAALDRKSLGGNPAVRILAFRMGPVQLQTDAPLLSAIEADIKRTFKGREMPIIY
jgi:hypothetical protein